MKAEQAVLEDEVQASETQEFKAAMKKAELKVQMARDIEVLQKDYTAIKSQYETLTTSYNKVSNEHSKVTVDLDKISKEYATLQNAINKRFEEEQRTVADLKIRLGKSVDEYNKLNKANEGERQQLKDRRVKLEKEILDEETEGARRKRGYAQSDKRIQDELMHLERQKAEVNATIVKRLKAESDHEVAERKAVTAQKNLAKEHNKVADAYKEFDEEKSAQTGVYTKKMNALELSCQELELRNQGLIRSEDDLKARLDRVGNRELEVTALEKKVKNLIKVNNLEKLAK